MKLDSPSLRPVTYQGCKGDEGFTVFESPKSKVFKEVE
jgi:hypothetical protein